MEFWEKIFIIVFSPVAIVAIAAYFGRKIFERSIDRDLEKYRAKLQENLEEYRNRLEKQRIEYQTKISYIHEKRANVLGEFYMLLQRGHGRLTRLTGIIQSESADLKTKRELTSNALYEAQTYYFEHKLYFENMLQSKIEYIFDQMWEVFVTFKLIQDGEFYKPDSTGLWKEAYEKTNREIPPVLDRLEVKFKEIIGITSE